MSEFLASVLQNTTPILLAAMGGLIAARAGIFNIGLEGAMLCGAFGGVLGASMTGSYAAGILVGCLLAIASMLVFAIAHLTLRADAIIAGLGVNVLAVGLTSTLLVTLLGTRGSYQAQSSSLPKWPGDGSWPLSGVLGGLSALTLAAFLAVPVVGWLLYRTRFGLACRSAGEFPAAATAAGISVIKIRYVAMILCGLLCGLAGVQVSMGILDNTFSENMVQGRGYLAFVAVVVGAARPLWTTGGALLLGAAASLGVVLQLQQVAVPPELVLSAPYLVTLVVLTVVGIIRTKRNGGGFQMDDLLTMERTRL